MPFRPRVEVARSGTHGWLLRQEGYEVGTVTEGEAAVDFESDVVNDPITFPCACLT